LLVLATLRSAGPGPIVRWPTSSAARIAVLVGCGRVEVGGWSPEAGQWAVEGRATGAGAGAGAAVQRTRKDRVAQLDLLDDDRAHVVLELHAPGLGLGVGGAGGSQRKFLSWRCARCTARSANRCWSCARRWSAICRWLSRRRASSLGPCSSSSACSSSSLTARRSEACLEPFVSSRK